MKNKLFGWLRNPFGEKHNSEKSGKKSKSVGKNYVNKGKKWGYFLREKRLVENLVENVENSISPTENPFWEEKFTSCKSNF